MAKHTFNVGSELPEDGQVILDDITRADITPEEVMAYYNKWASRYDKDLSSVSFYGPQMIADYVNEFCKENKQIVRILDIAAGTGAIGKLVHAFGFENIDALDPCENMLSEARKIGCYKEFYKEYMGKDRVHIDENTYDCAMTCGSMLPGHCNDDCFEEIIRILKPGGLFIFALWDKYYTTAPDWINKFVNRMNELEKQGMWKTLKKIINQEYLKDAEYKATAYVMQKI